MLVDQNLPGREPGGSGSLRIERGRWRIPQARRASASLVLLLALGTGCAVAPPPPLSASALEQQRVEVARELVERGRELGAQGDGLRAEQYFLAALAAGAPSAEVAPELVDACVRSERYRAAIQYARDALRIRPEDHRLRLLIATLLVGLGDFSAAAGEFEHVLARAPERALVHYALGVLYRDQIRDAERSDRAFRQYLRLAPEGVHAEEARGSLLTYVAEPREDQNAPSTNLRTDAARLLDPGVEALERPSGE